MAPGRASCSRPTATTGSSPTRLWAPWRPTSANRDHAIIEQVIAELKEGPLAHLPSGKKTANSAWLAHAVMAFNLARAVAVLAGPRHARTRWATLRAQLINIPARIATSGRQLTLHLPAQWPWANGWQLLYEAATGPPPART